MYVWNGDITNRRPYGLWMIPAMFWLIVNFFGLFFLSMFGLAESNRRIPRNVRTVRPPGSNCTPSG